MRNKDLIEGIFLGFFAISFFYLLFEELENEKARQSRLEKLLNTSFNDDVANFENDWRNIQSDFFKVNEKLKTSLYEAR
jgi:hypothetical protein